MGLQFQPLDFSELFAIGANVGKFFQTQMQLITDQRFEEGMYNVYKSQIAVNDDIRAFNTTQRMRVASRQAASQIASFAANGLSGGTIADDLGNYQRDLMVNAMGS